MCFRPSPQGLTRVWSNKLFFLGTPIFRFDPSGLIFPFRAGMLYLYHSCQSYWPIYICVRDTSPISQNILESDHRYILLLRITTTGIDLYIMWSFLFFFFSLILAFPLYLIFSKYCMLFSNWWMSPCNSGFHEIEGCHYHYLNDVHDISIHDLTLVRHLRHKLCYCSRNAVDTQKLVSFRV